MKKLIEDNYYSIVNRGLITDKTNYVDFIVKLKEEVNELINWKNPQNLREEMADVILTVLNFARHYNIDIEQELKNKILINKNRKQ